MIDEIIKEAPLIITKDFIDKYNIDCVVHGFLNKNDASTQDIFFEYPKSINKFIEIEYCKVISTTNIIKKIKNLY